MTGEQIVGGAIGALIGIGLLLCSFVGLWLVVQVGRIVKPLQAQVRALEGQARATIDEITSPGDTPDTPGNE